MEMQARQGTTKKWVGTHDCGVTPYRAAGPRFDDRFKPIAALGAKAVSIAHRCTLGVGAPVTCLLHAGVDHRTQGAERDPIIEGRAKPSFHAPTPIG